MLNSTIKALLTLQACSGATMPSAIANMVAYHRVRGGQGLCKGVLPGR